jgi:hypothetical protein
MRLQKVQKAPISPIPTHSESNVKMWANLIRDYMMRYEYVDPLDTVHNPDKALVFFPYKLL